MADARRPIVRLRALLAGACGVAYVIGALAFLLALAARLFGHVSFQGVNWLAWFVVEMALGIAAIWLYPYERPSRRLQLRMRLARRTSRSTTTSAPRA